MLSAVVTLNETFEAKVELPRLGVFRRGIKRTVKLSDRMLDQLQRSSMWAVESSPEGETLATRTAEVKEAPRPTKAATRKVKNG